MSKYQQSFILNLPLSRASEVCREVAAQLGWRVLEQTTYRIVCKENAPQVTSFTWSAKVEIELEAESQGWTRITLDGSIFGYGPIQSGHLKGQIGRIRNEIELAAKKPAQGECDKKPTLTTELEKLSELKQRGVLTDEEFQQAKALLLSTGADGSREN